MPPWLLPAFGLACSDPTPVAGGSKLDVVPADLGTGATVPDAAADLASETFDITHDTLDVAVEASAPAPDLGPTCVCGDGACNFACEDPWNCAKDCQGLCRNGACEPGENPTVCKVDCCGKCGDKKCLGGACGEATVASATFCAADCGTACGNKVCDPGETPVACPEDCKFKACGNAVCEGGEDPKLCPEDCANQCGDCVCSKGEDAVSCPVDCGSCGDGVCRCAPYGSGGATDKDACPGDCLQVTCKPGVDNPVCADANPCTLDTCDKAAGCKTALLDSGKCDDGLAGTYNDECSKGVCTGTDQLWALRLTIEGGSMQAGGAVQLGQDMLVVGTTTEPGTPDQVLAFRARVGGDGSLKSLFPLKGAGAGRYSAVTLAIMEQDSLFVAGGWMRKCDADGTNCAGKDAVLFDLKGFQGDNTLILGMTQPAEVQAIAHRGANEDANAMVGMQAGVGWFGRLAGATVAKPVTIDLVPPTNTALDTRAVCATPKKPATYGVVGRDGSGSWLVRVDAKPSVVGWTALANVAINDVACLDSGVALAVGSTQVDGVSHAWAGALDAAGKLTAQQIWPQTSQWTTVRTTPDGKAAVVGGTTLNPGGFYVNGTVLAGLDANAQAQWHGIIKDVKLPGILRPRVLVPDGPLRWTVVMATKVQPFEAVDVVRTDAFFNFSCATSGKCFSKTGLSCDDGNACTTSTCTAATLCTAGYALEGSACGSGKSCAATVCK